MQSDFKLSANYDYIYEGQRTLAKVYVGVGFQSLPYTPTKCCRKWCSLLSGWVLAEGEGVDAIGSY